MNVDETHKYDRLEVFDRKGELQRVELWVRDRQIAAWGPEFEKALRVHPVVLAQLKELGVIP